MLALPCRNLLPPLPIQQKELKPFPSGDHGAVVSEGTFQPLQKVPLLNIITSGMLLAIIATVVLGEMCVILTSFTQHYHALFHKKAKEIPGLLKGVQPFNAVDADSEYCS